MSTNQTASQIFPAIQPEQLFDSVSRSHSAEQEIEPVELTVQLATTLQEIDNLRRVWGEWSLGLDTDLDYFTHNLKMDSTLQRPHVITVWKDGNVQAMLVGHVRKTRVSTVVSFVNIPGPDVAVLEIVNGGRLGKQSPAIDKLLAMELLRAIRSGDVGMVCFHRLPLDSELLREVQRLPGLLVRDRVPHIFCYSVLSLTGRRSKKVSFLPGKARREVRRKTRILEREFPGRFRVKCFSEPDEMNVGIRDALTVATNTWQHHFGYGFSNTSQVQSNLRFFAKKRWLRVYIFYIDNAPCAFLIGQLLSTTFYCQYAGYHTGFARLSVGSLLTAWALENLAEAGVQQVDLGEGGQEHNRRLGCQMREEGTVHVYSPTWRGLCLNIFFGATKLIRAGGSRTRSHLRLNPAVKVWLHFLFSRSRARRSYPERTSAGIAGEVGQNPKRGVRMSKYRDARPWGYLLKRFLWSCVQVPFWPKMPRRLSPLRIALLRVFGAQIGRRCLVDSARIWIPWNLQMDDFSVIGNGAEIYNFALVRIGANSVVSQRAYLCTASHDYTKSDFPLFSRPITISSSAWIAACAFVGPGINVGEGAVVGACSVVTRDVPSWTVCAGNPCRVIKSRRLDDFNQFEVQVGDQAIETPQPIRERTAS